MKHFSLITNNFAYQFFRILLSLALLLSSLVPALPVSAKTFTNDFSFLPDQNKDISAENGVTPSLKQSNSNDAADSLVTYSNASDKASHLNPLENNSSLIENALDPQLIEDSHNLHCTYLGGGNPNDNLCSNPDGLMLHESFVINGSGYNGYHPQ